jgi:predicted acyltransferase
MRDRTVMAISVLTIIGLGVVLIGTGYGLGWLWYINKALCVGACLVVVGGVFFLSIGREG